MLIYWLIKLELMPTYNAITDTTLLSLLRYGATTLVAGAGETLTLDVGKLVPDVERKFQKIVGGVIVEMTVGEKTDVTNAETPVNLALVENNLISTDTDGPINLNPDGTGALNLGTEAIARAITVGNITGSTSLALNSGTGNLSLTSTSTGNVQIQAGATGNIDMTRGTLLHTSISTISTDAANKAIPLDNITVEITTTTSADTANIPNGTAGQKLTMIYVARSASSDELTITPATFASGNAIVFTDLGGVIELMYKTVGGWNFIGADSITNGTGGGKTLDNYTYVSIDDTDSPYAVLVTDNMIGVDPTVGSVIVNLPAISTSGKKIYVITDSAGTASSPSNEITINRGGSDLINGATSQTIVAAYNTLTLYNDSVSNWFFM